MEQNRPLGWTTLEESKLLVEAGLDPNTADMYYEALNGECDENSIAYTFGETLENYSVLKRDFPDAKNMPCWSLGALKKVVPDCIIKGDVYFNFHSIYSQATYYRATYEDVCFNKRIDLGCHKTEIALFVEIICWLIRNGYIKKSE